MTMTITSTARIVKANGVDCRVWEGTTERGVKVQALIPRVAALADQDLTQFERELTEHRAPMPETEIFPMRMIL